MYIPSIQPGSDVREYWLKHSTIPEFRWLISAIPENDNFIEKNLQPEAPDKIIAIIKERLLSERKDFVTVGSNKKDFLPSSFLQTGAQKSLTVCRIARYFSLDVFQNFIEELEKIADNDSFNSREKLQEIFSIPNQVADDIFQGKEQPLVELKHLKENQLSKLNPIPIGTGFLVGGTHLLTNHHVIPDQKVAEQCVAQFNYVEDSQGYTENSIDYEFEPEILFVSKRNLDYTLIQLKSGMFTRQAGYSFGWLQLIEDEEIIVPKLSDDEKKELYLRQGISADFLLGDEVVIIQHPKGRQKKIDQNENRVIENGLYTNFLRYQSDSDYGSSGSPVFNTKWELVALHHAVITKASNSESDSKPYEQKSSVNVIANQGVRICRIVEDLKKKSFSNPKLKSFIQDFVITAEQLNYPPLPAALEFDGKQSYVSLDSTIALVSAGENSDSVESESTIKFWSQRGVELKSFKVAGSVDGICLSPAGEALAFINDNDSTTIELWSIDGSERQRFEGHEYAVESVSFSPDGKMLASASIDQTIKLWNVADGQKIGTLIGHQDGVTSVSFSPDGKVLASASTDSIKLWSVPDRQEIRTLTGQQLAFHSVSFSPDGNMLASASNGDNTIKLWNVADGQEIGTLTGHEDVVTSISFSPDGKVLASASYDHSIKLWNVANRQIIKTLSEVTVSEFPEISISFSPDGKTLASVSEGIVKFWDINNGVLLKTLMNAGSIVSFNPVSHQYLGVDDLQSLSNLTSITIEVWVNPYPPGNYGSIISNASNELPDGKPGEFTLGINDPYEGNVHPVFHIFGNSSLGSRFRCHTTIPLGKFNHIATTFYNGQKRKIYVNGHEVRSTYVGSSGTDRDVDTSLNLTIPILIGAALSTETSKNKIQDLAIFFTGAIAEVRLWKVAHGQEQIQANMYRRLNGDEEGLIGYWRFDEGEGEKVYNLSSKQDDCGLVHKTGWLNAFQTNSLPLPYGLKFSEATDRVDCGNDEGLDVTEAITVEAWVKHKFGNCLIVSRGGNGKHGYSLSWHDGKIRVVLQGKNPPETVVDTKENAPQDRVWHHVAFTWDQYSQEISIYIDGRRQDSVVIEGQCKTISYAGQTQSFGLFTGSIAHLTANLMIGCKEEKEKYYNVAIAEVRLWKASRPQDKIKANMSRRLKGNEKGLVGYWRLDDGGEGNNQVRNLVSGNKGTIYGAKWFPVPEIIDTGNKEEEDSTDIS